MVDTQFAILETQRSMHGGVILFRGSGADARRYVEADRSRADDYYLGTDGSVASFDALDGAGTVVASLDLDPAAYAGWVDWTNPMTSRSMGVPRLPGDGRRGSPRFAEMVVNAPKSLSIAAALYPDVSEALDTAQQDAVAQIQHWLARHSVTRVGPRGRQEVVPVERLQTVAVTHRTSRAGDPHRHVHLQIGTRVWAAGKWRGLDTAALFKQQGAIRALGTGVLAAHPELVAVLDRRGLTLDPVSGEVVELEPFNHAMSKRADQVCRNLERLEPAWQDDHPGEAIGPAAAARLRARAWALDRPAKKPTTLREESAWVAELRAAGCDPDALVQQRRLAAASLDELSAQQVASRALNRCAATASAWTTHTIGEQVARVVNESGVRAAPADLREFIELATALAASDCFSILPPEAPMPEHVAHWTSLPVVADETRLRDLLTARVADHSVELPDVTVHAASLRQELDADQVRAAAVVASTDPLVIVEGAAGAGKTTMLATAIEAIRAEGGRVRVVAPTKVAAEVAHRELGIEAESVAALVHAHGWRWNADGVWTRLAVGEPDPQTGVPYAGIPLHAVVQAGERIVVDEAGMLDQRTAIALLTVANEAGAKIALVGDRAQLPAVGRGGVLNSAAELRGRTIDMAQVHRFTDPEYATLTVRMRDGRDPGAVFDELHRLGLIRLHADADAAHDLVASQARDGESITVASNDEAWQLNEAIRQRRVAAGLVDDTRIAVGNDGLPIGVGDLLQTRRNDPAISVANRQMWRVQYVNDDGAVWVRPAEPDGGIQRTVPLPAAYVREHTHLAYACTAYGVQGITATGSHTIVSDGLNASSVYVGMTRGRGNNLLHLVASDLTDARDQFIDAAQRDRADRGLAHATALAAEAVAGLVDRGPVAIVNAERSRLTALVDHAADQVQWWKQVDIVLAEQGSEHQAEIEHRHAEVDAAQARVTSTESEVSAPLIEQAVIDGTEYLDARERLWTASAAQRATRGWARRTAARAVEDASAQCASIQEHGRHRWGRLPDHRESVPSWAHEAAARVADSDPRVVRARQQFAAAWQALGATLATQEDERAALRLRLFGAAGRPIRPVEQISWWQRHIDAARRDLATIAALRVADAADYIAERAGARHEVEERARVVRARESDRGHSRYPSPDRGPSL